MIHLYQWFWNWFAIHTGTYNEPGPYYGFFSGFGSDLGEYVIAGSVFTSLILWYKKHNCHRDGCRKIGLHHVAGGKYIVCKHHHPDMGKGHKITMQHIRLAHEEYNKNVNKNKEN